MNKEKIFNIIKLVIVLTIFFSLNIISSKIISILKIDSATNQLILSFSIEIIYIIILFLLYRKDLIREFKVFNSNKKYIIDKCFNIWFYGFLAMCISNIIINAIIGNPPVNETSIRSLLKDYPIYVCFSTVIIAPIIEEFVFRKSFRNVLSNNLVYMIVTSLFFASLHITTSIDISPLYYLYLIPYASLGISFSYMNIKTDTIYSSIIFHIFHNILTMISALVQMGVILWQVD